MLLQDAFNELAYYTLAHPNPAYFIHQHVVDAFAAQTANDSTKPITLTFALAGLYAFLEKGYTGREVQRLHMRMAQNKHPWPTFALPANRGAINVFDVLAASPGLERDTLVTNWCRSVWDAYHECHATVATLADGY